MNRKTSHPKADGSAQTPVHSTGNFTDNNSASFANHTPTAAQSGAASALQRLIQPLRHSPFQPFLEKLLSESEISSSLQAVVIGTQTAPVFSQTSHDLGSVYVADMVRHMAHKASAPVTRARIQTQTIYVACLIKCLEVTLKTSLQHGGDMQDVVRTIVRPHLYRLEAQDPALGYILRQCLDWGLDDEAGPDLHQLHAWLIQCQNQLSTLLAGGDGLAGISHSDISHPDTVVH